MTENIGRVSVWPVCPDCYESDTDHCGNCWCCDGSMDEPRITDAEIPVWTDGWTAGYAAGINRALADCPTHAVCPNCREGWGHYTHEHGYLPTVQSESGGL